MVVKLSRRVEACLRVPLETYLNGSGARVYSLVASVPFAPIDVDVGRLARGEWNAAVDRFRFWFFPREEGKADPPSCYLMLRKFDTNDQVLLYEHVVADLEGVGGKEHRYYFTVGIMCNDDVRARTALSMMLDIPPSFHRRGEARLVEHRWRSDPNAVMRFTANVHSSLAGSNLEPSGEFYNLKFEPPPGVMDHLKRNMGTWWD